MYQRMLSILSLKRKRLIFLAQIFVVISMLYVGLKEKIPEGNQVEISKTNGALVFGELGVAYSKQSLDDQKIVQLNEEGFIIELDFLPTNEHNFNFQFLLLLTNGKPGEQLLIAQYGNHIIAMNGDDYNYSRKLPRLRLPLEGNQEEYQRLVLKVSSRYSQMTLNEVTKVSRKGRLMQLPHAKTGVRLVLSGSEYLENNWHGEIKKLTISALSANNDDELIEFVASTQPDMIAKLNNWLLIPQELSLLKHRVLEATSFRINSFNTLSDILINYFGFIPFGLLCAMLLTRVPFAFQKTIHGNLLVIFITFLCAFLLSFIIEYWQAWLITRHSSLRDLTLNSLGGMSGAIYLILYYRLTAKGREREAQTNKSLRQED